MLSLGFGAIYHYFSISRQSLHGLFGETQNSFVIGQTINLVLSHNFNPSSTAFFRSISMEETNVKILESILISIIVNPFG